MLGLSNRLGFLAAFGWCRNDIGAPQPVAIYIFGSMTLELIRSRKPANRVY